jgi:hypothetical protein
MRIRIQNIGQNFRVYHFLIPALYSIWVLLCNLATRRIRSEVIQEFLSTDKVTLSDPSRRGKYRPMFYREKYERGKRKQNNM